MARLFFAVWPDGASVPGLAALAARAAAETGGKPVPAEKIHLTLSFLGTVDAAGRERAIEAAEGVAARRFEMVIDRLGSFREARVAWAGCARPPQPLVALQRALEERLRERGFAVEERRYSPHVTLARNARRGWSGEAPAEIRWRADAFTLVRSETGTGRYCVERSWNLGD